ncbi:MAG: hypothetical protein HY960_04225 [Ignavibacteriae bacterium]|nr:hypothetical protein [Ignavibacteriota bacterium]
MNFIEFFLYRGGRIVDPLGRKDLTTEGYGFRLKGAYRLFELLVTGKIDDPSYKWFSDHVDFMYNFSVGSSDSDINEEHRYQDFLLVIKN